MSCNQAVTLVCCFKSLLWQDRLSKLHTLPTVCVCVCIVFNTLPTVCVCVCVCIVFSTVPTTHYYYCVFMFIFMRINDS